MLLIVRPSEGLKWQETQFWNIAVQNFLIGLQEQVCNIEILQQCKKYPKKQKLSISLRQSDRNGFDFFIVIVIEVHVL